MPRFASSSLPVENPTTEWLKIIGWSGPLEGLRESEPLLSAFFAASNVGLAIIDNHLNYLAINKALADMNGVPVEAHLGKSMREVLGEAAAPMETILHRVALTGRPVTNVAVTLQLTTRSEVGHWVLHYFPMNDRSGKVTRIGVVVVEVTEQRRMEEKLSGLADELRQEKERRKMLLEISTALNLTPDLRAAFPSIAASIRRVFPCDWIDLSILDEAFESTRLYATDTTLGLKPIESSASIPLGAALCGEAVAERLPKVLRGVELAAIRSEFMGSILKAGIRSACCIPFMTANGVVASFNVASTKDDVFHSECTGLLRQVAMQLANVLDTTFSYREIDLKIPGPEGESVNCQTEIDSALNFEEIVGKSPALRRVLKQAKTVAPSDATVLILGETGTGKELIARAIHHMSSRQDASFIKVNCAAIPSGLLESELFGHEQGAFTGAVRRRIGRLEVADHGTLFLDEIGDFPLELQPKLLRFLQEQEFERLGSNRTIRVNVRLLAATNRDLAQSVGYRGFRSDLYYRLNVFPIRMPALGERDGDIPLLVRYFVRKHALRMNKKIESIPAESMHALTKWEWPGNIRELENFIERSVILSNGPVLNAPLTDLQSPTPPPSVKSEGIGRDYILRALRESKGSIEGPRGAAARLGMDPVTLRAVIQRMNILPKHFQN